MKTHLSFQTSDLRASVAFYKTLLVSEPAKYYDDYAFFMVDGPALELALNRASGKVSIDDSHFGIAVNDDESVDAAIKRLKAAGYEVDVEREESCCYALQTKVWTKDPNGRRWEVYTVLAEVEESESCCVNASAESVA